MDLSFVTAQWIAPTHAHRFAPESATGNLLLGPAVAFVDRLRDVFGTSPVRTSPLATSLSHTSGSPHGPGGYG